MNIQKYSKLIISIILTVGFSYSIIYAWNGLQATSGDTLTADKWNEVVNIVETNSGKIITNETNIAVNSGKLSGISNIGGNIGIGVTNPTEALDINGRIKINEGVDSISIDVTTWKDILKNINKNCTMWSTYDGTNSVYFYSNPSISNTYTNCEKVYLTDTSHLIYPQRWGIDIAKQVNDGLWTADYIRTNFLYSGTCSVSTSELCNQGYLGDTYVYGQNSVHIHFAAWTKPKYSGGGIFRCACDL